MLLDRFYDVLYVLKPRASVSFQSLLSSISKIISDESNELDEIKKKRNEIFETSSKIEAIVADAQNKVNAIIASSEENSKEIARLKSESDGERKSINEYLSEATEKHASIQHTHSEASQLKASVEAYQEQFNVFQEQLAEREKRIKAGNEEQAKLFDKFNEYEKNIADQINKSAEMLSAATVSGLAGHYNAMKQALTKELRGARWSFYFGILFLFISSLPLVIFVLLPILSPFLETIIPGFHANFAEYGQRNIETGWQYLGQVLARFVILVPAAWFVSFTAIRHASLFRLREHYSYKYSMAVSVEGFKLQAKEYEQEIAALVLEQLAFNPTDKLVPSKDIKEGKSPHPIMNFVLERLIKKYAKDGGS